MSFTFNWAGVNVNPVQVKDRSQQIREDAGKWGRAVRGYTVDKANDEYANLLQEYSKGDPRIAEIQNKISALEAQNAELMEQKAKLENTMPGIPESLTQGSTIEVIG